MEAPLHVCLTLLFALSTQKAETKRFDEGFT